MDAHQHAPANHSAGMKLGETFLVKAARLQQDHCQRIAQCHHHRRARSGGEIQRTSFLFDIDIEKEVRVLCQSRFWIAAHGDDPDLEPRDRRQNPE